MKTINKQQIKLTIGELNKIKRVAPRVEREMEGLIPEYMRAWLEINNLIIEEKYWLSKSKDETNWAKKYERRIKNYENIQKIIEQDLMDKVDKTKYPLLGYIYWLYTMDGSLNDDDYDYIDWTEYPETVEMKINEFLTNGISHWTTPSGDWSFWTPHTINEDSDEYDNWQDECANECKPSWKTLEKHIIRLISERIK